MMGVFVHSKNKLWIKSKSGLLDYPQTHNN
jgi:hypothetical protein